MTAAALTVSRSRTAMGVTSSTMTRIAVTLRGSKELADLPAWLYLSFAGDYSVVGTITLRVTSRTVEVDGTQQTWVDEDVLYATDDFIRECDDRRRLVSAIRGELYGN